MNRVSQGEVWVWDLIPTVGREQRGRRPALVVSVDGMNHGPVGLAIVVPLTSVVREEIPTRVRIDPPEGGVRETSFGICEQVRTISLERFVERWGSVRARTLRRVARFLQLLTRPPE